MLNIEHTQVRPFVSRKIYKHALEYLQPVRAQKTSAQFIFSSPLGKSRNIIEKNDGLHSFDRNQVLIFLLETARKPEAVIKPAMSPSFTARGLV